MTKRNNVVVGARYGRLTVVGLAAHRDKWGYRFFECQCDCGGTKVVRSVNLNHGQTKSCGCLQREIGLKHCHPGAGRKPFGESSFTYLYNQYKTCAKLRLLDFSLSKDEFRCLVTQSCAYCGNAPSQVILRKTPKGGRANGHFVYNGIDRVDVTKGYSTHNSVACCTQCNKAKNVLSVDDFKNWLVRAHAHMFGPSVKSNVCAVQ